MELTVLPPSSEIPSTLVVERLGRDRFAEIEALNREVFGDDHVIHRLDREHLMLLVARLGGAPVGFKVGYAENGRTFYSAKGGVRPEARRLGVARALLRTMMREARAEGFVRLAFDTFPNKHPGMTVLGLAEGFTVTAAGFNATYRDYRIRFEKPL